MEENNLDTAQFYQMMGRLLNEAENTNKTLSKIEEELRVRHDVADDHEHRVSSLEQSRKTILTLTGLAWSALFAIGLFVANKLI